VVGAISYSPWLTRDQWLSQGEHGHFFNRIFGGRVGALDGELRHAKKASATEGIDELKR